MLRGKRRAQQGHRDWAKDAAGCKKAHVPEAIKFKTKPQIALEQMGAARAAGVPLGVV